MTVTSMRVHTKMQVTVAVLATCVAGLVLASAVGTAAAQCVDHSDDPAGCQPSTFRTPVAQMPTVRVDREGKADPTSSEADARAGAALLEKKLRLFRNFDHLHWVPLAASVKDPVTGYWGGGDLDGGGVGRSFAISGSCIFAGQNTARARAHGETRPMNVLRIQPNAETDPPLRVGGIMPPPEAVDPRRGIDDKETRALLYEVAPGEDRMILVRLVRGFVEIYRIDPETCLPMTRGNAHEFVGGPHEFFMWHDPVNPKRILVFLSMSRGGVPDPVHLGAKVPDAYALAVTDENTGEVLPAPLVLAGFSLHDVGGPPANELPDETGLYSDGRFVDYSHLTDGQGQAGQSTPQQRNGLHSLSVSDDGERVYVAGGSAGFYVLNSEAIGRHTNAELATGTAGCNQRSTVLSDNGAFDASKLAEVSNDCLHMVVNDDPGLKALLASGASMQAKAQQYLVMMTDSRFDDQPPISAPRTGIHSAVVVPNRPARVPGNTAGRPAYVFLTDENVACPFGYSRIVTVESEVSPAMIGAFAVGTSELDDCLELPPNEPDGSPRPRQTYQSHNPTVFRNLVFLGYMGAGMRAIDISRPHNPREVGHAITVPSGNRSGQARGPAIFKDGLMYWLDNGNGLHVARYTGPRRDELPGPGDGVYDGNSTSPHR